MARHCRACGRTLDLDGHDIAETLMPQPFVDGLTAGGRPRIGFRRHRQYACRTRLIATSPTGRQFTPAETLRRVKVIDNRHVHESRLQLGGDLYA